MTAALMRHAGGKVVAVLEGGYEPPVVGRCAAAMLSRLLGDPAPPLPAATLGSIRSKTSAALKAVDALHREFWSGLAAQPPFASAFKVYKSAHQLACLSVSGSDKIGTGMVTRRQNAAAGAGGQGQAPNFVISQSSPAPVLPLAARAPPLSSTTASSKASRSRPGVKKATAPQPEAVTTAEGGTPLAATMQGEAVASSSPDRLEAHGDAPAAAAPAQKAATPGGHVLPAPATCTAEQQPPAPALLTNLTTPVHSSSSSASVAAAALTPAAAARAALAAALPLTPMQSAAMTAAAGGPTVSPVTPSPAKAASPQAGPGAAAAAAAMASPAAAATAAAAMASSGAAATAASAMASPGAAAAAVASPGPAAAAVASPGPAAAAMASHGAAAAAAAAMASPAGAATAAAAMASPVGAAAAAATPQQLPPPAAEPEPEYVAPAQMMSTPWLSAERTAEVLAFAAAGSDSMIADDTALLCPVSPDKGVGLGDLEELIGSMGGMTLQAGGSPTRQGEVLAAAALGLPE